MSHACAPGTAVLSSVEEPSPAEWVRRTQDLLAEMYPGALWATLVVNLGDDRPPSQIVVIPSAASSPG